MKPGGSFIPWCVETGRYHFSVGRNAYSFVQAAVDVPLEVCRLKNEDLRLIVQFVEFSDGGS